MSQRGKKSGKKPGSLFYLHGTVQSGKGKKISKSMHFLIIHSPTYADFNHLMD